MRLASDLQGVSFHRVDLPQIESSTSNTSISVHTARKYVQKRQVSELSWRTAFGLHPGGYFTVRRHIRSPERPQPRPGSSPGDVSTLSLPDRVIGSAAGQKRKKKKTKVQRTNR